MRSVEGEAFSSIEWMRRRRRDDAKRQRQNASPRELHHDAFFGLDEGLLSIAMEQQGKTWEEAPTICARTFTAWFRRTKLGTPGLDTTSKVLYDALNYNPEFWDYYNDETGEVECVDSNATQPAEWATKFYHHGL